MRLVRPLLMQTSCRAFNDHSQAKLFARMSSNIKALIVSSAASERASGRSVRAQHELAAHMERQLVDLHEKEMRIARCW